MKRIKIITLSWLTIFTLLITGCKKYLDVNTNPNDSAIGPVSTMLTSAQQRIGSSFALGTTVGNGLGVYTHQLMQYGDFNRYGISATDMDNSWTGLYNILSDLDVIISQATTDGQTVYAGVAKVLKAYTVSMMVDIWGDIPYSEHNRFKEGIRQPKFDNDAEIYPKLFAMLDEAIVDIRNKSVQPRPGQDDLVYKGDTLRWVKAANTIKLKLYTQVRLVQDVSNQVKALLEDPAHLIGNHSEGFIFPFGPFLSTDDRYPGYGDYSAAQRGGQVPSHWMYEIMKGYNTQIYYNVQDPRIPYYFYNQKSASATPENCTDYRDGGFITLIFGSKNKCVGGSNSNTYTLLGIYPIGGRYDQGLGQLINASSGTLNASNAGTGAAPQRALTYTDRLYLEAELINAGVATGNQRDVFNAALNASFAQVDTTIINYIKPIQSVPALANQSATTTYKNNVMTAFDAATATRKLEYIMTQKWLSRIGNSVDNYTDYRRTGFPLLFRPAPQGNVNSVSVPGGTGGVGAGTVEVDNGTPYPLTLPWPQNEENTNSNAPSAKVLSTYKVFWMP